MSAVSIPDPAAYPHRWVTALPGEASGNYAIAIVDEDDGADLEGIAALQDAVEARRHVLIVARSVRGLARAVAAFQFLSADEPFYDTLQQPEIN